MTPDEHALMIGVLTRQLQIFKTLITILRSRGVMEQSDLDAFYSLIEQDPQVDMLGMATNLYHQFAEALKIKTGLEGPPKALP